MTTGESILLGIIQGVTEFLPISSSGHLLLAHHFLGSTEASLAFDVILHMGTLLAVLAYFREDWIAMVKAIFPSGDVAQRRMLLYLVAGTVPGAAAGFLLEDLVAGVLRSPWVVVATLSGVALLLALAEKVASRDRKIDSMTLKDAILVGIGQATAIIPGVSRSGITMTVGLFLGLDREAAARFSFLLSAPIIAGAGLYEGAKLLMDGGSSLDATYLWGFLASATSGYLVIAFLMNFLRRHTFHPFVWYRLCLATAVALLLWIQG